jgi:guanylate kinase
MSEYTMISVITPSNHGKNTLYLHTRYITMEDQEQSKFSFTTRSYLSYIRGVDYKGLNGSVTFAIYHMAQNIGCIRR